MKAKSILSCPECRSSLNMYENMYSCKRCDTKYLKMDEIPVFSKKEMCSQQQLWQRNVYDKKATIIACNDTCSLNNKISLSLTRRKMKQYINLLLYPDQKVLDLGCGTSDRLQEIKREYGIIDYGVDISFEALKIQAVKRRTSERLFMAEAERLPFVNDEFDSILAIDILEHVENIDQVLGECYRVLKVGGSILVKMPTEKDNFLTLDWVRKKIFPQRYFKGLYSAGHDYNYAITKKELKQKLLRHGFKIQRWKNWDVFFQNLWDYHIISMVKKSFSKHKGIKKNKIDSHEINKSFSKIQISRFRKLVFSIISIIIIIICLPERMISKLGVGATVFVLCQKNNSTVNAIKLVVKWLSETDIYNKKMGILESYNCRKKDYSFVYHEITGYAISSFLNIYKSLINDRYLDYAKQAADYLLQFQVTEKYKNEYGAVPHSLSLPGYETAKKYWSFDNAMILQGLTDLYLEAQDEAYYQSALLIAKWLVEKMQNKDGSFFSVYDADKNEICHEGIAFDKDFGALHAKHCIGLLKTARISQNDLFENSAIKAATWVLSLQREDGAFWSNINQKYIVTHAHCYAIEGLLYCYYKLKDERYLNACIKGADWLVSRQYPDGAMTIPAKDIMPRGIRKIESMLKSIKSLKFTDETAQAIRIWLILHSITNESKYIEAAEKAICFLETAQCLESEDINMEGGFYYKIDDTFFRKTGDMMYTWCSQFCLAAFQLYENRKCTDFYDYAMKSLF